MYKISVQDIEDEKDKTVHIDFDDEIPEIKAKIKASIDASSLGEFIEVKGNVNGTIKLTCDLCLKEFDYKLDFPIDEVFAKTALYDEYGQETEIKDGQFVTDLNGADEIDIYDLLYQSVILQLPNKKVCGINCKGAKFMRDDEKFVQDDRMAIFKTIHIEKGTK